MSKKTTKKRKVRRLPHAVSYNLFTCTHPPTPILIFFFFFLQSSTTSSKLSVSEECIYQASRPSLEMLLLHLASEGAVSEETLEEFLAPSGVRSKRQKFSPSALQLINPRGSYAEHAIGLFSKLPIPITVHIIRGLNFNEKVDLTSLTSKGFRSPHFRNNESLWSSFLLDLSVLGASVAGITRKIDSFITRPGVVKDLIVRTTKGGMVARLVTQLIVLPKFSKVQTLHLSGKRITASLMKKLATLPMCKESMQSFSLRNADSSVKEEQIVNVVVAAQKNLVKLSCELTHESIQNILHRSKLRENRSIIEHLDVYCRYYWNNGRNQLPTMRLLSTHFLELISLKFSVGTELADPSVALPIFHQLRHLELKIQVTSYTDRAGVPESPNATYSVLQSSPHTVELLARELDTRYSMFFGKVLRSCPMLQSAKFSVSKNHCSKKERRAGKRLSSIEISSSLIFEDAHHGSSSSSSCSSSSSSSTFPSSLTYLCISGADKLNPDVGSFQTGLASRSSSTESTFTTRSLTSLF